MAGEFHQVDGPWSGKLWIAARPRGGDWLEDEIARWGSQGAGAVLSLLTPDEERDLDLENEAPVVRNQGMEFVSLPVADRDIPSSESAFARTIEWLDSALAAGRTVVVHCRQGIGRSGMTAACALVLNGVKPARAIAQVSAARGFAVPETGPQREWIAQYASNLATRCDIRHRLPRHVSPGIG
jgi:protein-tyrosine phosphatase